MWWCCNNHLIVFITPINDDTSRGRRRRKPPLAHELIKSQSFASLQLLSVLQRIIAAVLMLLFCLLAWCSCSRKHTHISLSSYVRRYLSLCSSYLAIEYLRVDLIETSCRTTSCSCRPIETFVSISISIKRSPTKTASAFNYMDTIHLVQQLVV